MHVGFSISANDPTIHSFAFTLLKRFPLAAGIDPKAEIDDKGLRFDENSSVANGRCGWPSSFQKNTPREAQWTELLSKLTLSEVEVKAVRKLADFEVPLDHLVISDEDLGARLKEQHAGIRERDRQAWRQLESGRGRARPCEEVIGKGTGDAELKDLINQSL